MSVTSVRLFRDFSGIPGLVLLGGIVFSGCAEQPPAALSGDRPSKPAPGGTGPVTQGTSGTATSPDGITLAYEERGSGEPALVFVHGWCCRRNFWDPQLEHFSKSHRVLAIDLAGHGDSQGERQNWTMEAFGADVAAVVKKLGLKKVVIIGHSMGGPVMLEAAPLLKEELVGLVAVDAFHDPEEEFSIEQVAEFKKPFEEDFASAMRGALLHEHDFFTGKTDAALKERVIAVMTSAPPAMGVSAFQGMLDFANDRQRPLMEQVKVPFVCINARSDPAKVDAGKKHCPQFNVIVLPDSGHFLMMEHPTEFNRVLEEQLATMASS